MELVYKIAWETERCKAGHNGIIASAWSSSNLFVFTTEKETDGE